MKEIPFPPLEMRKSVGPTDLSYFDNLSGELIFRNFLIPPKAYKSIFDFGCGCGRNARRLMKQKIKPKKYVGIDLHSTVINWCNNNLKPFNNNFSFYHYDIYNAQFNPNSDKNFEKFPVSDSDFSLIIAHSVFTHITEDLVLNFLIECLRIMKPESYLVSTWFLFDKKYFPMMQESQNSLYINPNDPTNAVIYDHQWLFKLCQEIGLTPVKIIKPSIRGFQWSIIFRPSKLNIPSCNLPDDDAEFGIMRAGQDEKHYSHKKHSDFLGSIDEITHQNISGWAINPNKPHEPVIINVWQNGQILATQLANKKRIDLEEAGYGDGKHGFVISLPEFQDNSPINLTVTTPQGKNFPST